MVCLVPDPGNMDRSHVLSHAALEAMGRPFHPIVMSSTKSGRISHSTSHAETTANIRGTFLAQMVALRLTELHHEALWHQPATLAHMMKILN